MGFLPKDIAQICAQAKGVTLTGLRKDERLLGPLIVLLKESGTLYERIAGGINERIPGQGSTRVMPVINAEDCERLYHKWKNIPATQEFIGFVLPILHKEQEKAHSKTGASTPARDPKNPFTAIPRRKR